MEPGDVLLIDNYRMLHGRQTFEGDRLTPCRGSAKVTRLTSRWTSPTLSTPSSSSSSNNPPHWVPCQRLHDGHGRTLTSRANRSSLRRDCQPACVCDAGEAAWLVFIYLSFLFLCLVACR